MAFNISNIAAGGLNGDLYGMLAGLLILSLILIVAVYVYVALSYMKIAKKMKHPKPWLSWIPFADIAMWYQMGRFSWLWVLLMLIPFLIDPIFGIAIGAIPYVALLVIAHWRVFEKLKYPPWLSLSVALWVFPYVNSIGYLAYLVIIGIVAWKK